MACGLIFLGIYVCMFERLVSLFLEVNFDLCGNSQTNKDASGLMKLGGSLTRQEERDCTVSDTSPHVANVGHMVEDMENKMRSTLNEITFGKTKAIENDLRFEKVSVVLVLPLFRWMYRICPPHPPFLLVRLCSTLATHLTGRLTASRQSETNEPCRAPLRPP